MSKPMLPDTGFLRLKEVLRFIPVSPSVWWKGVREGIYPKSVKLKPHITAWRAEDIKALIEKIGIDQQV